MDVRINNQKHKVPELTFEHFTKMEEQGFSIIDAFHKKQYLLLSMGFVCAILDCDRDEAEGILTQHILGGGNVKTIVEAFMKAVNESDFFTKMLGIKVEETTPAKKENIEE